MKIMVIGCGQMGAGLAQSLSLRGHTVTVIDKNAAAFEHLGPGFKGRTLVAIGFDRTVLEAADIAHTDGLAAVTNSDEANVVTARLAREHFRVPRVVARVVDPHKAEIYRRLGVQTISTTVWGVNRMANLLTYTDLNVVLDVGNQIEVVAVEIAPMLAGRMVNTLAIPGELQVMAISRGGKSFLPTGSTVFQSGDLVYCAVLAASADRLSRLVQEV